MSDANVVPLRRHQGLVDPEHVQWALGRLFAAGLIVEVRCIGAMFRGGNPTYDRGTIAGYFDNAAAAAEQVQRLASAKAVYFTLNPVLPVLFARSANVLKMASGRKRDLPATTTDDNIAGRRWLLIDVDSVRPAEISAADREHGAAIEKAAAIEEWLRDRGWPDPIVADSGNGGHLLYRVDLPNDDASRDLTQRVLFALAALFDAPPEDQDRARNGHEIDPAPSSVDTAVFNASRICKLYGTRACKGDNLDERPHRMSRVLRVPEGPVQVVELGLLEALAAEAPDDPKTAKRASTAPPTSKTTASNSAGSTFSVGAWVAEKVGHLVGEDKAWKGAGRRWVFDVCPFNSEHSRGEAWVAEMPSGAAAAGCLHESCTWGWAELRERFEPRAKQARREEPAKRARPWDAEPAGDMDAIDRLNAVLRWTSRKDGSETLQASQHNLSNLLRLHPNRPNLWHNSFSRTTYIELRNGKRRAIGDKDYTIAREWLSEEYGVEFPVNTIASTMDQVAGEHQRNPLVEWLRGLRWDGHERIDHWLCYALGIAEDGIAPVYGRKFLVSAVARALDPGSKVDTMLVLTGPQGSMKSTLFHTLAGDEYFCDTPLDLTQRQVYLSVEASWFVEFAELASFRKAEIERIKAFVTSRKDTYTPPYGRCVVTSPRHCVFVGTTNEEEFLKDQTGNRRFWCVRSDGQINIEWVRETREQLWAEAVAAYDASEGEQWRWWLTPQEEAAHAVEVQEFEEQDQLTDRVLALAERGGQTTVEEIARILRQEINLQTNRGTDNRIGAILRKAGWERKTKRLEGSGGRQQRVWVRPATTTEAPQPLYQAALDGLL